MNVTLVKVDGRSLIPQDVVLGNQGDMMVEALQFEVPEIFEGQSAWAVYRRSDAITDTVLLDGDGVWQIDRTITNTPGNLDVFLRVISANEAIVWDSNAVRFLVRPLFHITENTVADDQDELENALAIIGAYAADSGANAEAAAQSASDSADSAQEAGDQAQAAAGSASEASGSASAAAGSASESAGSASAAAGSASAAAGSANAAAQSAQEAADSASAAADSAQAAQDVAQGLENPQVTVTTLTPGSQATAQWEGNVLSLGIPRGYDGSGAGDMTKSTYDPDGDGIVDKAESLTGSVDMNQVTGLDSALAGKAASSDLTAHTGNTGNPHQVTAAQVGAATTALYTATLTAAGWTGSEAPYSQTVAVSGLLDSDSPFVDILQTGTEATDEGIRDAWGNVTRLVASANSLTAYASAIPEVDIPIQVKVVR